MAPNNVSILREWLASLAVKELESALDVFAGYVPGMYQESPNRTLSCAPDNITIRQRKKKALQIIEFLDTDNSSSSSDRVLLVSDGTSLIKAIFEENGISAFETRSGRKVDDLKGALIITEQSDLVFYKDADPSDALKLRVLIFKLYGGERAGTFGSPEYFSTEPSLKNIFRKLNVLISGPLASSLSSLSVDSGSGNTPSQMLPTQFATQIMATQSAEVVEFEQEAVIASSIRLQTATNTPFYDISQRSNPFENMKRVPRKFARVPRDQQLLLESENSWYNPSKRVINIPESVRQGLVTFLEQKPTTIESTQNTDEDDGFQDGDGDDGSQDSNEDEEQPPGRVELNSSERKILNTLNHYSSSDKPKPTTRNPGKFSPQGQTPEAATPSSGVSQDPPMTFAVAVEMGEFEDDEDEDLPLPSLPIIPPSTAKNRSPIVQVKRTPRVFTNPRSSGERLPRENRENSSSNPSCIPATHVDLSSQQGQSSVDTRRADEGPQKKQLLATKPIPSLPPSVESAPATTYSLQNRGVEKASLFPMNPPTSLSTGVANISAIQSRYQWKGRRAIRKSRGRMAEEEFFANQEPGDPEEALRKAKEEFYRKIKSESEDLKDSLSRQPNGIPSSIKESDTEGPASRLHTSPGNVSSHNRTILVPSTSYEPEDFQPIDQDVLEPTFRDLLNGGTPEVILALKRQISTIGSSTGPDDEFQPESSPWLPHLTSPRQELVDSQELVLSIESETVDSAQDDGHKKKLHAELNLSKDDENLIEGLDDDEFEEVSSCEEPNIRKSPVSEEDDLPDPLPIPIEHWAQEDEDNDDEDTIQQDQLEYLAHEEHCRLEVKAEVEEGSLLEDLDPGSLNHQAVDIIQETVVEERFSQAEIFEEPVEEERVSQAEFNSEGSPGHTSFFDLYKSKYPSYTGTTEDFTTALVYLEWLLNNRKLVHPSFFDDFVNFYPEEYLALRGDKLGKRGYDLFHEVVDEPTFTAKIIFRHNLQDAISSMDETVVAKNRARFEGPKKDMPHRSVSKTSTPAQSVFSPNTPTPMVAHHETAPQEQPQEEMEVEPAEESGLDDRLEAEEDDSSFEKMAKPKSIRQRFFDTPSQAFKRKESPVDLEPFHSSAKKHRTLPWQSKSASKPKQPQFQVPRSAARLASPELGEEPTLAESYRPSTRPFSPPPLKDPDRRKTIGTDKVMQPKQPQLQVPRSTPRLASPKLGEEPTLPQSYRPSTRPISPPPLKDPNRRKTIGTDKVTQPKPKPQSRYSMAPPRRLDVGPRDLSVWEAMLRKNKDKILGQSRSPSVASSAHSSSSSKRKASWKSEDD